MRVVSIDATCAALVVNAPVQQNLDKRKGKEVRLIRRIHSIEPTDVLTKNERKRVSDGGVIDGIHPLSRLFRVLLVRVREMNDFLVKSADSGYGNKGTVLVGTVHTVQYSTDRTVVYL